MKKLLPWIMCLALVLAFNNGALAQCGGGSGDHGSMDHSSMGHQGSMGTGNMGSPPAGSYSNPGPAPGTGTLGPYPAGSVTKDSWSNPDSGSAGARRPADASGPSGHQH
jgi:hypothetical protein